VPITFLPFELGVHKCYVVFSDEAVGEMQYTIIGRSELPDAMDTFRQNFFSDQVQTFDIGMPFRNIALDKARTLVADRAMNKGKASSRGKIDGVQSSYFDIEISNPYFSGPSSINLTDNS
jgi:hypothetical protein